MEENENENQKVSTEEIKTEASQTVSQVKDTIKKVDLKKDSKETKGFVTEMFKNPLGKIQEIVSKDTSKFLTYAIILLIIWTIAVLLKQCFSLGTVWGYRHIGSSLLSIVKATITPLLSILTISVITFAMNHKNKKALTTIMTVIIAAKLPIVIASVISLLTIFSSQISMITVPIANLCSVISIVLTYFALKAVFGIEKNSDFIKKFVMVEVIYYIVYFVLNFLGIYI